MLTCRICWTSKDTALRTATVGRGVGASVGVASGTAVGYGMGIPAMTVGSGDGLIEGYLVGRVKGYTAKRNRQRIEREKVY